MSEKKINAYLEAQESDRTDANGKRDLECTIGWIRISKLS